MKENNLISKRVEDTLNSLDGLQKASPGPFFYTRVMARMETEEQSVWSSLTSFFTKPYVVAGIISAMLLINATAVFQSDAKDPLADQADVSMVDEYKIASTSFYDYTNTEP